jgi:ribosomal protein S18 acetylase RimI-like enzyme
MNFKIRLGNINDLSACLDAPKDSTLGDTYYYDKEKMTRIYSEVLMKNEIYVAEFEGNVRGYLWYEKSGVFGHFPYVRSLAIHKDYRGKGIGSKLLSHVEKQALKERGKIFLLVSDFNDKARKMYESRGYKALTKIENLFIDGVHENMMLKTK